MRDLMRIFAGGLAVWSVFQVISAFRGYKETPIASVLAEFALAWFGLEMAAIALNTAGPLVRVLFKSN